MYEASTPAASWPTVEVTEKAPTINPSCPGVAPISTAYSGSSGSMIETPAWEMNASSARTAIARSMPPATEATRPRRLDDTAAG